MLILLRTEDGYDMFTMLGGFPDQETLMRWWSWQIGSDIGQWTGLKFPERVNMEINHVRQQACQPERWVKTPFPPSNPMYGYHLRIFQPDLSEWYYDQSCGAPNAWGVYDNIAFFNGGRSAPPHMRDPSD